MDAGAWATHREAGIPSSEQAALGLLEGAESIVHSASEVAVEVVMCGRDVVVAGSVCELQPSSPASQACEEFSHTGIVTWSAKYAEGMSTALVKLLLEAVVHGRSVAVAGSVCELRPPSPVQHGNTRPECSTHQTCANIQSQSPFLYLLDACMASSNPALHHRVIDSGAADHRDDNSCGVASPACLSIVRRLHDGDACS